MIKVGDLIIAPSRGSAEQAIGYAKSHGAVGDFEAYIREVYRLAPLVGIDASIIVSQSSHETGNWTSPSWVNWLNPAGLGITYSGQDPGYRWQNGTDAARAQIAHMLAYVADPFPTNAWFAETGGNGPGIYDPRFDAVALAGWEGTVRTIADLTGKWATDKDYHTKIAAKGNDIFPGIPDQGGAMAELVFSKVPHPGYTDRLILTKPEGVGWDNLGKRTPRGVTWHRIIGYLWGTDTYFRRPDVKALTDYGIGVASVDGAENDGKLLRWVDPRGTISGWASGPYRATAYGDGRAFAEKYGIDAINRDRVSIEISGFETTPLTPAARQAIAALTAYWADQAKVPWDSFPIVPWDGFSFVVWHNEITGTDYKSCPAIVVMDETAMLIEMTRAILKQYQTQGAVEPEPPPYAPLMIPAFLTPQWMAGGEDARFDNGVKVFSVRRRWQARVDTPRLQHAGDGALEVGPVLPAGRTTIGVGLYHSHGRWIILDEWGARLEMDRMTDFLLPGYPTAEAA